MESGQGARAMEGKNYGKSIWGVIARVLGNVHLGLFCRCGVALYYIGLWLLGAKYGLG